MTIYALTVLRNTDKGIEYNKLYYTNKNKAMECMPIKFNEEFGIYRYFPGYKRTTKACSISCDIYDRNLGSVYIDEIVVNEED